MTRWAGLRSFFDAFEMRVVYISVLIAVPYLALGISYFFLQGFGFELSQTSFERAAAIVILFLFIVGLITAYVVHVCATRKNPSVT